MCANGQEPAVEGALDASPASHHELLLNLRALGAAQQVRDIVEQELSRIDGKLTGLAHRLLSPRRTQNRNAAYTRREASAIPETSLSTLRCIVPAPIRIYRLKASCWRIDMDLQLTGKTALVSGLDRGHRPRDCERVGPGRRSCHHQWTTAERVQHALEEIRADHPKGKVEGVAADLATTAGTEVPFSSCRRKIDIRIKNNLGFRAQRNFLKSRMPNWMRFFEVNVLSGVAPVASLSARNGRKNWGRITLSPASPLCKFPWKSFITGRPKQLNWPLPAGWGICCRHRRYGQSVLPGPTRSKVSAVCQRYGKARQNLAVK